MWQAPGLVIFNMGTQRTWKTPATLQDVESSLTRALDVALDLGLDSMGLPRIGAGLGGLKWADVSPVLVLGS